MDTKIYQPGAILHDVLAGAFRAKGTSFDNWCKDQGISPSTARQASYGQSGGDRGDALRARLIDGAGREVVEVAYRKRLMM